MSTNQPGPRSALAFIREHVDHAVKLRFIILLHESPSATISVETAARTLRIPNDRIREMGKELAAERLVRVTTDTLELAPASIDDRLAIADLAEWFARDRTGVLDALRSLGRLP
jgi:hypothetical protein